MSTAYRPVRRRWSLRVRLTALVLTVAALALGAVDVLLPLKVRSSLLESQDSSLQNVIASLRGNLNSTDLQSISRDSPIKGEIGFSAVKSTGMVQVLVHPVSDADANPELASQPSTTTPQTVSDVSGGGDYRALATEGVDSQTGQKVFIVAWLPLNNTDSTIGKLIFAELLITAGLLVLLGATASVIIRRELKPLEAMATAADDIAGGDLDRRVYPGDAGTEVGRLGFAFNGMLDGISLLIAERERSEERLRQFLADASHELRTPVAAVRGYTDLYKAGALPDEAAVGRAMERMGFEAIRMGALVGDLLTLIQADAEKGERYEPVNVAELLVGVVDDAAVIDRTRLWRLVGTDGVSALVQGDRLRLHQLFANLLANIRTHTDPGTIATITLTLTEQEVNIEVSDNGPGVSDADLPKLFDRFYRADASRSRERGGTGLGLSIVAAIARGHRGQIMASHTPGGGLTTAVVLPRWLPAGSAELVQATDGPASGLAPTASGLATTAGGMQTTVGGVSGTGSSLSMRKQSPAGPPAAGRTGQGDGAQPPVRQHSS